MEVRGLTACNHFEIATSLERHNEMNVGGFFSVKLIVLIPKGGLALVVMVNILQVKLAVSQT